MKNQRLSSLTRHVTDQSLIAMGLVCLLLPLVFTQADGGFFAPPAPWLLGAAGLAALVFWALPSPRRVAIVAVSGGLVAAAGVLVSYAAHPAALLLLMGLMMLAVTAFALWLTKRLNCRRVVILLIAAGFLLRLCYVLYTPVWMRQHDVWLFSDGNFAGFTDQRHAQYIEYIATYLRLPAVDPTQVGLSQLYHPPLHHLLAGLWLRLNVALGVPYAAACENIQLLTLFYSGAAMLIGYRILRQLKVTGMALVLAMAVLCLHPTFILMAGSVNNDVLSITLAMGAILAALRWYESPGLKHLLLTGLWLGLSMMTKLSGGLVAPAIALLFAVRWVQALRRHDGSFGKMTLQFLAFGAVCLPLGLWWPVRNALLFHMPLTYVPALSASSDQYIGDLSVWQRLTGWPGEGLRRVFMAWQNTDYASSYNEFNPLLGLLKTAVFGETALFNAALVPGWVQTAGEVCCTVLFYAGGALAGLSLYAGVRALVQKRHRLTGAMAAFWLVLWAVVLGSYLRFCFAYPFTCTQNFRYAVPTLLCGCVWLAKAFQGSNNAYRGIFGAVTALFCLSSAAAYLLLGC